MKIEIENSNLVRVINFLDSLSLKGMKSIHRTNLSRKLMEKLKTVGDNEKQLREELKDEPEKLKEELEKFFKERVVIDGGDSQTMLQSVKSVIKSLVAEDSEYEFKDNDAYALACLYDQFELDKEETA
ncbi:hypothetical protein QNH23_06525 [Siminovitchia fortis]|uniref:Uncharacterized protein n=1 Tax=Siminovitchia fortis TaxID=254758 RepID=A0A443IME8_9BACI|nr:hypothetical protein [Siminovitchia fortis]RWR06758.1 hypothetical protein D4N35_013920 [Siminovitchia fortis]WHY83027.1 hypothetical protein QNH23_06525 [Siminovitchia fortis]